MSTPRAIAGLTERRGSRQVRERRFQPQQALMVELLRFGVPFQPNLQFEEPRFKRRETFVDVHVQANP